LRALSLLPLFATLACNTGAQPTAGSRVTSAPENIHEFSPVVFYNDFSATTTPVLRISPGDSIRTRTIDAAGSDAQGVTRGRAGNPQTGPFIVSGAAPGDTLAITLTPTLVTGSVAGRWDIGEYRVSVVVGRNAGIVMKLSRDRLQRLKVRG
jgi:hypothetical protein